MPPFTSTSKLLRSMLSRSLRSTHFAVSPAKQNQIRCSRSIAGVSPPSSVIDSRGGFISSAVQRRRFLGCGDGEEGGVLSRVYEERRVLGYSPEQLFDVVAAVDLYHGFVPWCQRSDVLKRYPDGSFDAELEIGFKFLVESYVSHVVSKRPKMVKTTASQSGLFDHLINEWEFNPGPVPGSCDLYFLVDFKFQSPLYRRVASMFFKEVVSRLVGSFSDRCRLIYGPGVHVLENSQGHKTLMKKQVGIEGALLQRKLEPENGDKLAFSHNSSYRTIDKISEGEDKEEKNREC